MGWFDSFAANGCRKAMQGAYVKGRTAAQQRRSDESPHWVGLAHALQSRYLTRGLRPAEPLVWAELAPFLLIADESSAVAYLAEYVIYQERPHLADVPRLTTAINKVLQYPATAEEPFVTLVGGALAAEVTWTRLLTSATRQRLSGTRAGPTRGANDPQQNAPTPKDIGRFLHHQFLESVISNEATSRLRGRLNAACVSQVAIHRFPNRLRAFAAFIVESIADDVFKPEYAPEIAGGFTESLVASLVGDGADENGVTQFLTRTYTGFHDAVERERSGVERLAVARKAASLLFGVDQASLEDVTAVAEWTFSYATTVQQFFSEMKS